MTQQHTRAPGGSYGLDLDFCHPIQLKHVGACYLADRDPECLKSHAHAARRVESDGRALRPLIVLHDNQKRKLPQGRDVERLVNHTLTEGAIAYENNADPV